MTERKNTPERNAEGLLLSLGYRVTKRGWPDFIGYGPDGRMIAVEVKPRTSTGRLKQLKREQVMCLNALKSAGIPVFLSDGTSLEPY